MTTDPISDFLIRLKNANRVGKTEVAMPFSKMKHELANLLAKEGYVGDIQKTGKRAIKNMVITLTYKDGKPAIVGTKRISKPSRRIYRGVREIFPVKRGKGLLVLSTPKGVLTDSAARREKVGGEALFEIW